MAGLVVKPCTTFTFQTPEGNMFFGRNFDFPAGVGMVNKNQRGIVKESFVQPPEKKLQWRVQYGSISFNQIGREFPYGGMNEAGLVIEQMWLQEAEYPAMDHRYGLMELQWIQYHLDMSASVQEVIDSDTLLRISPQSVATLHFLVADAAGNTAVIEFLEGKMEVYHSQNMPYTALANCPYQRSVEFTKLNSTTGSDSFSDWTKNSSGRFAKAVNRMEYYKNQNPVDFAFTVLDSVAQPYGTQWSIVYDIHSRDIFLRTGSNAEIREISLSSFCFDLTCLEKIQADIHSKLTIDNDFGPYNYQDNLNLLNQVCEKVDFLGGNMPHQARIATAEYAKTVMKTNLSSPQSPCNDK